MQNIIIFFSFNNIFVIVKYSLYCYIHIINQITIKINLILADMNNKNDKKKLIIINFIKIINAAFINKITDLKLFSMNLIKYIKLICQLTVLKMNIIMFQNSMFILLN